MNHYRNRPHTRTQRFLRAFTLLELLTVISIIGLLISLAVPSLKSIRKRAKDMECLVRLKSLYSVHMTYLHDYQVFSFLSHPPDENDPDRDIDGAWQYNYQIFDGDYDENFGPLVNDGSTIDPEEMESLLFCPVQYEPFHSFQTRKNPWPLVPTFSLRAGYGRRYHLSGKSLAQIPNTIGILTDIFHVPQVIRTAHKNGINAVYTDGHGKWVLDRDGHDRPLTDNDLTKPFDAIDNEIIEDLWDLVDEAQ